MLPIKVLKIRITPDNMYQFYAKEWRRDTKEFKNDVDRLVEKLVAYAKGEKNELTERYPERYDLTVLTYSQNRPKWCINDGSHRLDAMRVIFEKRLLDGFDFWLIPSNVLGARTKKQAYKLNKTVNKELKKYGLPEWVKKFDFEDRDGKLIAWKNINLIDTGNQDKRKQYGVDWFLNEDPKARQPDKHNYKNKYN